VRYGVVANVTQKEKEECQLDGEEACVYRRSCPFINAMGFRMEDDIASL
jgi:hypothetical protein